MLKRLTMLTLYAAVLVVSDWALSYIPNIQVSMLLVVLLATLVPMRESLPVVTAYVIIDNLLYGGLTLYTIPMLFSWYGVVLVATLVKKYISSSKAFAILSIPLSVWYALPFMGMSVYLYSLDPVAYILADIPFWILMALSSYFTIDLLYSPLHKMLKERL